MNSQRIFTMDDEIPDSDPSSLIPSLGLQESAWLSVHLMTNDYGVSIMSPDEYRQMELEQPIIEQWRLEHGITDTVLLPGA